MLHVDDIMKVEVYDWAHSCSAGLTALGLKHSGMYQWTWEAITSKMALLYATGYSVALMHGDDGRVILAVDTRRFGQRG